MKKKSSKKKAVKLGKHRPVVIKTKSGFSRAKNSRLFPQQITLKGEERAGTAMSGLPKAFAKMGFKKGWAAYKRSGHKKSGKRHSSGSHRMSGDFSVPSLVLAPVKRLSAITPGKVISPIIDLGLIIVGMILAAGLKKVSPIKNPHLMNGAQTVVGVGGSLMTKNRFIKMPLLGVALQSTIAEAKILFPKMVPLAGDDEVVYLPVGADPEQIEYAGDDERVGTAIGSCCGEETVEGDDERVGTAIGDEETAGEGNDR